MRTRVPMFRTAVLITAVLLATLTLTLTLTAQNGAAISAAMAENARLLRQYTFKQRIEVQYKGEEKATKVNQVRFDANGKRDVTVISETGGEEPRGLGARLKARKRDEMKAYAQRLTELIEQYLPLDAEKLRPAINSADVGRGGGQVSVTMKNYYKTGDEVTLAVDGRSRRATSIDIKTTLDKDAISINADFSGVSNGPSYPGTMTIQSPKKDLEIRITAYDFMKL